MTTNEKKNEKNDTKKTKAKRMGVKAVLSYGEKKLAITAFGKGNDAEIAVKTDSRGTDISPLPHRTERFTVNRIDNEIGIEHGALEALINNPAETLGEDYLKLKATLEQEFFGQVFPNDNVRIQIIHNILDIQKIIGLYVSDIIYCINNLRDETHLDHESDIVGLSMSSNKTVNERMRKMIPYLGFFGDAFQVPPKPKPDKNGKIIDTDTVEDKHNVAVLRILGALRQITAHFKHSHVLFSKYEDLEKYLKKEFKVDWQIIETNYSARMDTINNDFMKKSNMNLHILFDMLGAKTTDEKTTIVEEYYRFSILKKGKYLGVNMKTIRETMIHTFYPEIKDKQHDSYRSKLYAITDYLLFRSLHKSSDLENMVAVLRETSDEGEKDILYRDFAKTAWEKLKDLLVPFFKNFKTNLQEKYVQYRVNKDSKTDSCNEPKVDTTLIDGVKMSTSKAVPFVQLLAFLCHFLEGKEINELLSAYIHKFENIQSFINTLKELGETVNFSKNYALFDDSGGKRAGEIAKQLRVLVSIGKMKPDLDDAKRVLYKAAIETLGVPDDSQYVSDEWLAENVLLDKTAPNYKNRKTDINPFRNFIAGNVISSRRFMYLVRYTKPKTVRALMSNRTIVHYVLSRIADIQDAHITESQLDRYYQNLPQYDEMRPNVPKEQKINALADYLVHYSFEKNVFLQKKGIVLNTKSPQKNVEIERLKALTGLYLTVAFIAIKNLVKANARYYIAFAAFERDHEMMKRKSGEAVTKHHIKYGEGKNDFCDAFSLTEYFLDCEDANDYHPAPGQPFNKEACRKHLDSIQRHFSKKWREIFRQNITEAKKVNATGFLLTEVRNHAAHLNVVTSLPKYVGDFRKKTHGQGMQSYFELYHYLMQRLLCEEKGLEISQEQKMFIDYGK